jgi:hypothetical protein
VIISHLTPLCGGNVHVKNAVSITALTTWSNNGCHQVADFAWKSYSYWKSNLVRGSNSIAKIVGFHWNISALNLMVTGTVIL